MKKIFKSLFIIVLFLSLSINSFSYGLENTKEETISKISIDKKIGMNGHIDVPKDILLAGSVVREYHNFGWSMTENKQMYFERFSWWDFDGYYKYLYDNGVTILPCIQMGEEKIFGRNKNEKPVLKNNDTTDPMSYKIHSNYLFNYAARYGSTKVDTSKLNLDPNDSVKTGLGYIEYYEDWNEPDKTWLGKVAEFSPIELAAMLSADYDGHEGKLGDTYGVKQADPNAKLVMGGMAGGSTMVNWLTEIQEWANKNRTDKKLPLDVINYHQYTGTHSPENSTFVEDAKKIIKWRDANAKDKEIWITEFGWDTNPNSVKHAAPSEDAQRDWIIREYLIGDRIGLDKMTVFDALNDGAASDATQYSTSGLATKVSEGAVKKSSWYGVNTLKNTLKGYTLKEVIQEDNKMYIYKYINGDSVCYVLWSPTENNTIINNFSLNIEDGENATLTILKDKETLGVTTNLTINNSKVNIDVSESPIFVKVKTNNNDNDNKNNDDKKINNDNSNHNKKNNDNTVVNNKENNEIMNNNTETNNNIIVEDNNKETNNIQNTNNTVSNVIDVTKGNKVKIVYVTSNKNNNTISENNNTIENEDINNNIEITATNKNVNEINQTTVNNNSNINTNNENNNTVNTSNNENTNIEQKKESKVLEVKENKNTDNKKMDNNNTLYIIIIGCIVVILIIIINYNLKQKRRFRY